MNDQELITELATRFTWLVHPRESANGSETVDEMSEWFGSLKGKTRAVNKLIRRAKKVGMGAESLEEPVTDKALFDASCIRSVEDQIRFLAEDPDQIEVIEEAVEAAEADYLKLHPETAVICSVCHNLGNAKKAHLHQGVWICDEVCWEDRLRSSE